MSLREQLIKDFGTDALLVPSLKKRCASYAVSIIFGITSIVGIILELYELAAFSLAILSLCAGWYGMKAYRYIQDREDKQK